MGIHGLRHVPLYRRGVWGKYSMYTLLCSSKFSPKILNYAHTAIMTWHGSSEFTLKISWTGWIFTRIPLEQILTSTAICGKRTYPGSELDMLGVRWGTLASIFLLPKWLHGSSTLANLRRFNPLFYLQWLQWEGQAWYHSYLLVRTAATNTSHFACSYNITNDRTLILKGSPNCNGLHKCMHNFYIRVGRFFLYIVVVSCLLCHNLLIIHIDKPPLVHLEDFAVVVLVHDSQWNIYRLNTLL